MYYRGVELCPRSVDWRWSCQTIHYVKAAYYVKHYTKYYWTLRTLFHKKLREGALELTQLEPEV